MYLSQAVSLPAWIRIQSDLFLCTHLVQEVQLEHAVVTCRVVAPTYLLNHERRAQSRPVQSRIARDPPSLVKRGFDHWSQYRSNFEVSQLLSVQVTEGSDDRWTIVLSIRQCDVQPRISILSFLPPSPYLFFLFEIFLSLSLSKNI